MKKLVSAALLLAMLTLTMLAFTGCGDESTIVGETFKMTGMTVSWADDATDEQKTTIRSSLKVMLDSDGTLDTDEKLLKAYGDMMSEMMLEGELSIRFEKDGKAVMISKEKGKEAEEDEATFTQSGNKVTVTYTSQNTAVPMIMTLEDGKLTFFESEEGLKVTTVFVKQ